MVAKKEWVEARRDETRRGEARRDGQEEAGVGVGAQREKKGVWCLEFKNSRTRIRIY